ncbi:MAG: hypothetical protein HYU99_11345 [Deltaproteobacteria bacterium]|nr:hypothetical protein [Deltaproteobacteria bacterium]
MWRKSWPGRLNKPVVKEVPWSRALVLFDGPNAWIFAPNRLPEAVEAENFARRAERDPPITNIKVVYSGPPEVALEKTQAQAGPIDYAHLFREMVHQVLFYCLPVDRGGAPFGAVPSLTVPLAFPTPAFNSVSYFPMPV